MPNYTNMATSVKNTLARMGMDVTYVKNTTGSYVPSTGVITRTQTTHTVKAVKLEYTQYEMQNTQVKQGDCKLYMDAVSLGFEPKVDDFIRFSSDEWAIKDCKPLDPAGVKVLYELQLRQ